MARLQVREGGRAAATPASATSVATNTIAEASPRPLQFLRIVAHFDKLAPHPSFSLEPPTPPPLPHDFTGRWGAFACSNATEHTRDNQFADKLLKFQKGEAVHIHIWSCHLPGHIAAVCEIYNF